LLLDGVFVTDEEGDTLLLGVAVTLADELADKLLDEVEDNEAVVLALELGEAVWVRLFDVDAETLIDDVAVCVGVGVRLMLIVPEDDKLTEEVAVRLGVVLVDKLTDPLGLLEGLTVDEMEIDFVALLVGEFDEVMLGEGVLEAGTLAELM